VAEGVGDAEGVGEVGAVDVGLGLAGELVAQAAATRATATRAATRLLMAA